MPGSSPGMTKGGASIRLVASIRLFQPLAVQQPRERLAPEHPAELMGEQPGADGGRHGDEQVFERGGQANGRARTPSRDPEAPRPKNPVGAVSRLVSSVMPGLDPASIDFAKND